MLEDNKTRLPINLDQIRVKHPQLVEDIVKEPERAIKVLQIFLSTLI